MFFIFRLNIGQGSSSTSKSVARIIINIIDINNSIEEESKVQIIKKIEPYIRKVAHYSIYVIGGFLITNAVFCFTTIENRVLIKSSLYGILYAISDELHQVFVPNRSGNVKDVLVDSLGVLTGVALFLLVSKIIKAVSTKAKG